MKHNAPKKSACAVFSCSMLAAASCLAQIQPPAAETIFRDLKLATMAENLARGDYNAAMLAKSQGVNVNAKGKGGIRPIHYVASWAHEKSIGSLRALISAGADLNVSDDSGQTPLGISAARPDSSAVGVLLGAGARPGDTSKGQMPALIAAESRHERNFELLVNAGTPLLSPSYPSGSLAGELANANLFEPLLWMIQKNVVSPQNMPASFWRTACGSNNAPAATAAKILSSKPGAKGC